MINNSLSIVSAAVRGSEKVWATEQAAGGWSNDEDTLITSLEQIPCVFYRKAI